MRKLEVFFDYACPYCLRGHENLLKLAPLHPEIEIIWRPCEAHPRPDRYGPHSDLCIAGMYFAADNAVDVWAYHQIMFKAALVDRVNIESIDVLCGLVGDLLDTNQFRQALENRQYTNKVQDGNKYAFLQSDVWAVPAYRMDGKKLDSIEDVGVTFEQLKAFLLGSFKVINRADDF